MSERDKYGQTDEDYMELGRAFLEEYNSVQNHPAMQGYICADSPVEIITHLLNAWDDRKPRAVDRPRWSHHPDALIDAEVQIGALQGALMEARAGLTRALDYRAVTPEGLSIKADIRNALDLTSDPQLLSPPEVETPEQRFTQSINRVSPVTEDEMMDCYQFGNVSSTETLQTDTAPDDGCTIGTAQGQKSLPSVEPSAMEAAREWLKKYADFAIRIDDRWFYELRDVDVAALITSHDAATIERCAKMAEEHCTSAGNRIPKIGFDEIAAKIRALEPKP